MLAFAYSMRPKFDIALPVYLRHRRATGDWGIMCVCGGGAKHCLVAFAFRSQKGDSQEVKHECHKTPCQNPEGADAVLSLRGHLLAV